MSTQDSLEINPLNGNLQAQNLKHKNNKIILSPSLEPGEITTQVTLCLNLNKGTFDMAILQPKSQSDEKCEEYKTTKIKI